MRLEDHDPKKKERYFRPAFDGYVAEMDQFYHKLAMKKIKDLRTEMEERFAITALTIIGAVIVLLCMYQARPSRLPKQN